MSFRTREIAISSEMYSRVLPEVVDAFHILEQCVPAPALAHVNGHRSYRFQEKSLEQAIVLKLARLVTGLQATWAVLNSGFPQEAAALQRILDELGADIMFLAGPLTVGAHEDAHDRFLKDFYQEEFDEGRTPIESTQKRDRLPRKKVRAYIARTYTAEGPVSDASAVFETIDSTYSGFIHAASVHIMDTYGGSPPRFQIEPMYLTSRLDDAFVDFRNYLLRSLTDVGFASYALKQRHIFDKMHSLSDELAIEFKLWPAGS